MLKRVVMTTSERRFIVKAQIVAKHAFNVFSYIKLMCALKVIMHVIDIHNELITSGK